MSHIIETEFPKLEKYSYFILYKLGVPMTLTPDVEELCSDHERFGELLWAWRGKRGMTLEMLSGFLFVSPATLDRWEKSQRLPPDFKMIRAIREALEMPRPDFNRMVLAFMCEKSGL